MLNKLHITGFKSIDCMELTLKNLTLLTGENSSGKSTVIQAILMVMKDYGYSFEYSFENENFNEIRNVIIGSQEIEISMTIDDDTHQLLINKEGYCLLNHQNTLKKRQIVYLSADRIGVRDTYQKNYQSNEYIGVHGEYAFDYLSRNAYNRLHEYDFIYHNSDVAKNLSNQVNYWLHYILGYEVSVEQIEGTDIVKVSYTKKMITKSFRPKNIGTGVSYLASVIISALSCEKNDILIIENPEIHLHPSAQSKVASLFAFLASRGLQIIVETHSDHIFNGIRRCIKANEINLNEAEIYFFTLDKDGLTACHNIQISERGQIKNYMDGLFDQFDLDLNDLLDL